MGFNKKNPRVFPLGGDIALKRQNAETPKMHLMSILLFCAACLQPVSTYNISPRPQPPAIRPTRQRSPVPAATAAHDSRSPLEKVWARYVLLRPEMSYDELKKTTQTINFRNGRTPGTNRTMFLSTFLLILAAIPVVFTNERVVYWLLELAALDRAGVTPAEMLEQTGRLF